MRRTTALFVGLAAIVAVIVSITLLTYAHQGGGDRRGGGVHHLYDDSVLRAIHLAIVDDQGDDKGTKARESGGRGSTCGIVEGDSSPGGPLEGEIIAFGVAGAGAVKVG